MPRPFASDLIIDERICESYLKAYHVGFDEKKFRFTPLVEVIRKVIPEFALGYHAGKTIPLTEIIDRLKEAAETIYLTDKYQRRGEFGELILHLLLRDFRNTIPLVSKIFFKDSHNMSVHGFDGVHVTEEGSNSKLWLGESKLYKSGKEGIKDLITDIKKHVNADYLRREFTLISRKLPERIADIEKWRGLLDRNQKIDTIFSSIVIPMICTYNSELFNLHNDNTPEYFKAFDTECKELYHEFEKHKGTTSVEIILMLLPIPDKDKLNKELDLRLKLMQQI